MKKQPRRGFRILAALGIFILMIAGFLVLQTLSIIRPRQIDQTLSMRCVGACPAEFMHLHLQGHVDQFHQVHGFLQVGELEIKLENRDMMPTSLFPDKEYQYGDMKTSPFAPDLVYVVNRPMTQWFITDGDRSFLILPVDFDRNQLEKVERAAGVHLGSQNWN